MLGGDLRLKLVGRKEEKEGEKEIGREVVGEGGREGGGQEGRRQAVGSLHRNSHWICTLALSGERLRAEQRCGPALALQGGSQAGAGRPGGGLWLLGRGPGRQGGRAG